MKNHLTLLVQCNEYGVILEKNLTCAWKPYGSKTSFRSSIAGNILIMSEKFYQALPLHLRPLAATTTIVVTGVPDAILPHKKVMFVETLQQALMYQPDPKEPKKHFIASCPTLYIEALALPCDQYDVTEIIALETEGYYQGYSQLPPLCNDWRTEILQTIRHDDNHPFDFRFIHHIKKVA